MAVTASVERTQPAVVTGLGDDAQGGSGVERLGRVSRFILNSVLSPSRRGVRREVSHLGG